MDTSKEYILMCEQAKDLQYSYVPQLGDYVCPVCNSADETCDEAVAVLSMDNPTTVYQKEFALNNLFDGDRNTSLKWKSGSFFDEMIWLPLRIVTGKQ